MPRLSIPALLVFVCGALIACGPAAAPPAVSPPAGATKAIDASICSAAPVTDPPSCPKGCVFDNGKCEPDRGPPVHD